MSPSRILLLLTLMLVGLVTLFQQIGVLFGTSCLFSLVLVVVFLTSEGSPLLFAQEAENRFWTVVATLLSSVVFFAEDSPLRIGHKSPLAGAVAVAIFTCWISWYDRWLRRRRLVRAPHFAKPSSTENLRTLAADPAELDASIEALAKVDEAVRVAASWGLSAILRRRRDSPPSFERVSGEITTRYISHTGRAPRPLLHPVHDHETVET